MKGDLILWGNQRTIDATLANYFRTEQKIDELETTIYNLRQIVYQLEQKNARRARSVLGPAGLVYPLSGFLTDEGKARIK